MTNKKRVPEIRFKGFSGEWEEKKLEDIRDVRDGTHNSPKYLSSGYPFVTSKNVKNGYVDFDDIQYISKNDFEEINKRSKVDINDILLGMIGTIGNIALIRKEPNFAIKNVALIKDIKKVDNLYLYTYLQNKVIFNQLDKAMDGGTQKFIALNKIRLLKVFLPKLQEQIKIGNYFQKLDNLIEQKEQKQQKLKQLKKAMLNKMFPKNGEKVPEIRFKGFSKEWEEKKLEEIFDYERPDDYIVKSTEYSNNYETPVLTANKAFILGYTNELNTFNKPSIIFDDFTLDFKFVDFPYMVKSSALKILTLSNEKKYSLNFMYNLLSTIQIEIMGHARHYISIVQRIKIYVPNIEEQTKIGNYFQKLDKLIELEKKELEKLKDIKKSLLNKMFI